MAIAPISFFGASRSRIVVGVDRLQVVRGRSNVVVQIPYWNLRNLEAYDIVIGARFLDLDVAIRGARETFWGLLHGGVPRLHPHHVIISDHYVEPLDVIAIRIIEAQRDWSRKVLPGAALSGWPSAERLTNASCPPQAILSTMA
jgi:hypothetical protein